MAEIRERSASETVWLSAHLHFPGLRAAVYGEAADNTLLDIVAPFIALCQQKDWIRQYFFIRYIDAGAHVRFRLAGDPTLIHEMVRPALVKFVREASPGALIDNEVSTSDQSSEPVSHMLWVPYEPEIMRYGGTGALPVAESFFHTSSEVAMALLPAIRGRSTHVRLGQGLLAMLILSHALSGDEVIAGAFFDSYRSLYLSTLYGNSSEARESLQRQFELGVARQRNTLSDYVEEAWSRLTEGESISAPLDKLTRAARHMVGAVRAHLSSEQLLEEDLRRGYEQRLTQIISSQVHMMNNRLGIRIDEEAYLAHACAQGLRAVNVSQN